jgi:hypothetical protein
MVGDDDGDRGRAGLTMRRRLRRMLSWNLPIASRPSLSPLETESGKPARPSSETEGVAKERPSQRRCVGVRSAGAAKSTGEEAEGQAENTS